MATDKKKEVKVRDLKPSKDAKGGAARNNLSGGGRHSLDAKKGGSMQGKGGGSSMQGFGHKANS